MIDLYKGDCLEIMDELIAKGVKVDLIITSPPYNLGHSKRKDGYHPKASRVKYNSYSDNLQHDEYIEWQVAFLNKCFLLLSEKGLIYYNHKQRHKAGIFFHPIFLFQNSNFNILQNIIWHRAGGTNFNIGRFVNSHEDIIVGYKNKSFMRIKKDSEKDFDVWRINQSKGDGHPASFPLELPTKILQAFSEQKDITVFDPFMGVGTTGVACKNLGRDFIGIEMDDKYFDIAKERIYENY